MADKTSGVGEISAKEFQRKLFDWFDKRGLLSELRAFMRYRMISALYSSESPCPANHFSSQAKISPPLQALLLLVAEFLVQQEYHYTMSVMVAEVPLLASFPKFSDYVSYMSHSDSIIPRKGSELPRYAEKDVLEILEVLGMTPDSESAQHILRLYSNNSARESLLACVLTALSAIVQHCFHGTSKQSKSPEYSHKKTVDIDESTHWIEEIRLVLLRAQLSSAQLQKVEDIIHNLHSDTTNRVRKEEQDKYNKLNCLREQQILAEVLVREERFRAQTVEAEDNLRQKQSHLEQVTTQLKQQHDEVLSRLNRVQNHADEIRKQENELIQREKALEQKQANIEEEHRTLAGLRADLQEAAQSIRQEHSDAKTLLELNRLQERCLYLEKELKDARLFSSAVVQAEVGVQATDILECEVPKDTSNDQKVVAHDHQHSSGSSECSSNSYPKFGFEKKKDKNEKKDKSNQTALLKRVLRRVQQENSELRGNATQQRRRIDELTARAAQLATYISNQTESPILAQAEQPIPVPIPQPPPAPPLPPRHVRRTVPLGAGGDLTQAPPRHSPATTAHTIRLQGREWRRKPPKRLIQHASLTTSLSSDESPTEEVLREARNRLRRLEEESEAVDRSYRDFRARQADSLGATASVLFEPAQHLMAAQGYQENNNLRVPQSVPPSMLSSTPFLSAEAVQSRPSALTASLSSRPTPIPRLPPNFLTLPQSQYTLPERSLYSISQVSNSIPYRPLVLGRPVERLRNLLGAQSSLLKEFPAKDAESHLDGEKVQSESAEGKQEADSGISAQRRECTSNVLEAIAEKQKANIRASFSDKGCSPHSNGAHPKLRSSVNDSQIPNQVSPSHESSQNGKELSIKSPLPKVDDKKNVNLLYNSSLIVETKAETSPLDQDHILSLSNIVSSPDKDNKSPPPSPIQSDSRIAEDRLGSNSHIPLPSDVIETLNKRPGPTNESAVVDNPSPLESIVAKQQASAETAGVVSQNRIDSTSNEISTLSSAVISVTNLGNVTNKGSSNEMNSNVDKQNNNYKSSLVPSGLSEVPEERKKEPDLLIPKLTLLTLSKNGNSTAGSANQLLHTSLSSIENSDQRISGGSGGKQTSEDDDDFW